MPQLILEYSNNIIEQTHLNQLLQQCNTLLTENLPTELAACKSRAIAHSIYTLGDGNAHNAFVHVNLKVMAGRTENTLQNVGQRMMELLSSYFAESRQKLNLQISLEMSELASTYFKIASDKI